MAEVVMVPGGGFMTSTDDDRVIQMPGVGFFTEDAAAAGGLSIPIAWRYYQTMAGR